MARGKLFSAFHRVRPTTEEIIGAEEKSFIEQVQDMPVKHKHWMRPVHHKAEHKDILSLVCDTPEIEAQIEDAISERLKALRDLLDTIHEEQLTME